MMAKRKLEDRLSGGVDQEKASVKSARRDEEQEQVRLGLVRVELALSNRGHCGWCDTAIAQGTPRVVKRQYHAPGEYIRNNGASRGYNPGGIQCLYLHPQCAWTAMAVTGTKTKKCSMCQAGLPPGSWHFATRLGRQSDRCVESTGGKLWQCVPCVGKFLHDHRSLLRGYVGERSQFDEPVAWRRRPDGQRMLFGSPVSGRRPEPSHRPTKEAMRSVFRWRKDDGTTPDEDAETRAAERHRQLQATIAEALKHDKLLGGKLSAK